jgi:hypothetical protein
MHATLYLLEPVPAPALRLPVDLFLRSLAEDRGEHAIGVILSGMGSDGMLGLKAIKGKGGLGLAQDPVDAKFDGMPKSVIDAGLADIVAPAAALPDKIVAYLSRRLRIEPAEEANASAAHSALEKILILLRDRTGKYLEPAAGKVNINILAMAREGLREALIGTVRKALKQTQPIRLDGIRIGTDANSPRVDVVIQGLTHPDRGRVHPVFFRC